MNFIIESSITKSKGYSCVLFHDYGSQLFSSINISDSKQDWHSAYSNKPSSLSITNYSNFRNLSSDNSCCFDLIFNRHNFYFCNVIDNKILTPGEYHVGEIFYLDSATFSLEHCFFKGNNATKLIDIPEPYDDSPISTASVSECHFESDNSFPTNADYIQNPKLLTELIMPTEINSSTFCELPIINTENNILIPAILIQKLIIFQPAIFSK